MADTLVKRVGGKSKLADWLKSIIPYHTIYCEPFGGSFAVGLRMPKADGSNYRLVYNDEDKHVSNFFKVLRESPAQLSRAIDLSPYSRNDFDLAHAFIKGPTDFSAVDPVEWARKFLIYNRQSIFGKETGDWCIARNGENVCMTWANLSPMIVNLGKRLKEVYIECGDYRDVLSRWDCEHMFAYLDPPYLHVEKDFYSVNKENGFDHVTMAQFLKGLQGSWGVSYYDSEEIRDLYAGYTFHAREVKKHMQTSGSKSSETELFIVHQNEWSKSKDEPQCF